MGGQRMPIGGKEKALELVLQLDPIFQYAVIVTQMQTPGGAHA